VRRFALFRRSFTHRPGPGFSAKLFDWRLVVVAVALVAVLAMDSPLPARIGVFDFRAYWTASYLLGRGENFADEALIFQVQKEQTGLSHDWPVMTWNPPWLLAMLLPYTLVSFRQASWWWLITNVTLLFIASVMVWQTHAKTERARWLFWLGSLLSFSFSFTLVAFIAGQVNILLVAGLAGFIYFWYQDRPWLAGMSLVFTLVKPHLVYLALPLILLELGLRRQWRAWAGFVAFLVVLTVVAFWLRPSFVADYGQSVAGAGLLQWQTPTLGGALAALFGWHWAKAMGLFLLPVAIYLWWRGRERTTMADLVDVTLIVSIITAPFGWSYDYVVLLLPLLRLAVWLVEGEIERLVALVLVASYMAGIGYSYYQRIFTAGELYFFWMPLLVAALYFVARRWKKAFIIEQHSLAAAIEAGSTT
jgi:hypothetical protein